MRSSPLPGQQVDKGQSALPQVAEHTQGASLQSGGGASLYGEGLIEEGDPEFYYCFFRVSGMPDMGLELMTPRSRAMCSAD